MVVISGENARTIFFGRRNELGLSEGYRVLFGTVSVLLILLAIPVIYMPTASSFKDSIATKN